MPWSNKLLSDNSNKIWKLAAGGKTVLSQSYPKLGS